MASLPPGVQRTPTAIRAYVKVRTHQVQRSFPLETPIVDVLMRREETRRKLTLQHGSGAGSLSSDIGNYLSTQTKAAEFALKNRTRLKSEPALPAAH